MNLSELAKELEISVATVSRVLTGVSEKYRISAKTRDRVMAAAEEFGVVADPLGASLRTGKTGMMGLLVPDITNPYFATMARAVELRLREKGIALMLSDSNEDAATELELIAAMRGRRLDGMILASVGVESERLEKLICGSGFRVVLLDRVLPGLEGKVTGVSLDNYSAGKIAVERLLEVGHRKIGCVRGNPESDADCERLRGVTETLANEKLVPQVVGSGYEAERGLQAAKELLSQEVPSAVITLTGQAVLAVLQVAQEKGLRVPADLSLVGFDEQPWASFLEAPLTTVVQPVDAMAARAVELVLGDGDSVAETFEAILNERSSVKVV